MYFATGAARTTAIPSPTEGMTTYRSDVDALEVYNGTTYIPVNRSVVSYIQDSAATLTLTSTTETGLFQAPSFTPIAGRLYEVTMSIGVVQKSTTAGQVTIRLRKDTTAGASLDTAAMTNLAVGEFVSYSKTVLLTSTQMGTSAFVPLVTVQASTNGMVAYNTGGFGGAIIVKDIGLA